MRHSDEDTDQGFSSEQSKQALHSLKSLSAEPSPFLRTRILARVRENKVQKVSFFKKYFLQTAFGTAMGFVLAFVLFQKMNSQSPTEIATYLTGQAYVIRMDIRPYKESEIAYAEILLNDENIEFTSSQHSEISQQKKLIVSWESVVQKQFLPIVIKGTKSGPSIVIVNFYDIENKLVNSQNVNLQFKGG
jgi:hypothetical protein